MTQLYHKLCLCIASVLLLALNAVAGIEVSQTLPGSGTPEHRYTMMNANNYYCNATTSPTQTKANYAQFAFYSSDKEGAYYIYNVTAQKWVSYDQAASYSAQTGFVKMTDEKSATSYFKFTTTTGGAYEIQPYTTTDVASIYINWYKGTGSDNPVDGSVTLGLWTDNGAKDKGSRWTFSEVGTEHTYKLFSDGMPDGAQVIINGQTFTGLNAQGTQEVKAEQLEAKDITVKVGGGYLSKVTIDNANYQVDVTFIQFFTPTTGIDAEKKYTYRLHMPLAYVKKIGDNLLFTTNRAEADKFIFIEEGQGKYYIYDQTAQCYIYYTATTNGSTQKATTGSNVKYTTDKNTANTWQMLLISDDAVAIIPGSIENATTESASLNFTGGIAQNAVLNLWKASDSNSAWNIEDPSAGAMPCATLMYAVPGAPYIHKLVTNEGETVKSVDFGTLASTLTLNDDRLNTGNKYKYVAGKAPAEEGEYTYTINLSNEAGEETQTKVTLIVSNHLQSPTPMMGWLTWNWFARAISHDKMVEIAKGMQKHGLIDAGFNTIVLDDAWAKQSSDKAALTYDPAKFPNGISGLKTALKQINDKLKVGIYSDAGSMTCENYQPGSYGYEGAHIALFDSWGVDMLKYDYCNSQASTKVSYTQMGNVIAELNDKRKEEGKEPFVFNICEWGKTQPWTWGAQAGGSSWRATSDAREDWIGNNSRPGVLGGCDEVRNLWMYAGVNRFNDLDMMCIGLHGLGGPSNNTKNHQSNGGKITGLTDAQARTQMSLWCMFASPLALTCDLRETPKGEANANQTMPNPLITAADIATLTNTEILAINQDALGQQAEYMATLSTGTTNYTDKGYDVYVKDLTEGRIAVSVTNRSTSSVTIPDLYLTDLYLKADTKYNSHEVWSKEDASIENTLTVGTLSACETKVYVISPITSTSIQGASALQSAQSEGFRYDLSGRKVAEDYKGVSIKNGVKEIK